MKSLLPFPSALLASLASSPSAAAYAVGGGGGGGGDRRAFLSRLARDGAAVASSSLLGAAVRPPRAAAAVASQEEEEEDVYFGAGCFWHVQHEFVLAERTLLDRKDSELTSRTGYAGGTKADGEGRVCYHNFQNVADYGKLGHGEVVGIQIPTARVGDFAGEYFALFGEGGERADPMDQGGEYRSLLGLPGGRNHPMFGEVEAAAGKKGMTLADGKGNDPDTLGKRLVYVYDSNKFPFYQAEVYHQYHNDFLSPAYGKQYNDLADAAVDDGRIRITGCPDRVHRWKTSLVRREGTILAVARATTVCLVVCGLWLAWSRPKLLRMLVSDGEYESVPVRGDDDDVDRGSELAGRDRESGS